MLAWKCKNLLNENKKSLARSLWKSRVWSRAAAARVLALGQAAGPRPSSGWGARRLCQLKSLCSRWQQLNKDFAEFQKKIEDVDRRLAALLCQGFDDCNSMASAMKVRVCPSASVLFPGTEPAAQHAAPHPGATMGASPRRPGDTRGHRSQRLCPWQLVHMFAFLLERPLIKAEVSPYYSVLLGLFKAELENVKVLFDTQTASSGGGPALHSNMPPVAGRLKWAKELQQRLEETHGDLFAIDHPYVWVAPGKGPDPAVPCGCSCSSSCPQQRDDQY